MDLVLHGGRWEDEAGGRGRGGAEHDRVGGELALGVGGALVVDVVLHGWGGGSLDGGGLLVYIGYRWSEPSTGKQMQGQHNLLRN